MVASAAIEVLAMRNDFALSNGSPDPRLTCLVTEHTRKRVLLIEDDENLVRGLVRGFRRGSFDTQVALRGDAGLDMALTTDPDVVVLDMGLPGMRGSKILEELQRRAPDLPIVVITGDVRWQGNAECWDNVVASFQKPFPAGDLVRAIDTLLGPPPGTGES